MSKNTKWKTRVSNQGPLVIPEVGIVLQDNEIYKL